MNTAISLKRMILFILAMGMFGLPSCSKDNGEPDDNEGNTGKGDPRFVGTWFTGSISGGRYNTVTGRYEGAKPPLDPETNAAKYWFAGRD